MIQNAGLLHGVTIKHDIPYIPIAFILFGDNVTEEGRGLNKALFGDVNPRFGFFADRTVILQGGCNLSDFN